MAQGGFDIEYMKSFNTFSGADIVASFGNQVFGELQAITYAVQREVAAIYTMGSSEPRSFSRGKRGISGSLVFIVFDRDALLNTLLNSLKDGGLGAHPQFTARGNVSRTDGLGPVPGVDQWNLDTTPLEGESFSKLNAWNMQYLDQIPPFDITISFANEYGQRTSMQIMGVQILNEGSGMSIDDMVIEKACSFVAKSIKPIGYTDHIRPGLGESPTQFA